MHLASIDLNHSFRTVVAISLVPIALRMKMTVVIDLAIKIVVVDPITIKLITAIINHSGFNNRFILTIKDLVNQAIGSFLISSNFVCLIKDSTTDVATVVGVAFIGFILIHHFVLSFHFKRFGSPIHLINSHHFVAGCQYF